jgi:hypothetical protein
MTAPVSIYKTAVSSVAVGGTAVTVAFGPLNGGLIVNPPNATQQGIAVAEVLYVDVTGSAYLGETETTVPVQPGQYFTIIPGQVTNVSVNAATSGHLFSGIIYQPSTPYPPTPQSGSFPPLGPTTLSQTLPSYLYQEYADDDDLQAFVASYNQLAQQYVNWFANIGLPVYTGTNISGALLNWVAEGLYGFTRPALASGMNRNIGPYNTWAYNTIPFNKIKVVGPANVTVTSDDIFKRIITWNFYKGDGNTFNIRWLKRRIMRFLIGTNGTAPNIDQTYAVSVTYGPGIISIRLSVGTRTLTGGAVYNRFGYGNAVAYNQIKSTYASGPTPLQFASVFKEASDSGVLQYPFQYSVVTTI